MEKNFKTKEDHRKFKVETDKTQCHINKNSEMGTNHTRRKILCKIQGRRPRA